jgi:phytoene synthase
MPTIEEAYEHCRRIAKARARHFFYSFRLLPPLQRQSMCAIYAFMRHSDDIVDEDDVPVESRRAAIREWRSNLQEHFAGSGEDMVLTAFCDTFKRHSIPRAYSVDLLDGMEGDLAKQEFQTFEDLYRYCYQAASVVGMTTIRVFGFEDREALALAERCGIAFQLTNIMRDIAADAAMGRVYLPAAELAEHGLGKDELLDGTIRAGEDRFQRFMDFQYQRAERYYRDSAALLSMTSPPCRAALWAMIATYHGILKRIREAGYDVLGEELGHSRAGKLAIASQALWLRVTGRVPSFPG